MTNTNLAQHQITPEIRVSTAVINLGCALGRYDQYETWCFSDDKKRQQSFQVIHGTCWSQDRIDESLASKSLKVHNQIVNNLKIKRVLTK
jgi:hypothetical protein